LVLGVGVHGGHQALDDAEVLQQDLGHRRHAVGGAGGVGDDLVVGRVVLVVVDAHDDGDVLLLGGGGDDHLLGAAGDVRLGGRAGHEAAGGLDHDVHPEVTPGQVGRVALGEDLDRLVADDDRVALDGDRLGEPPGDRVVLQQVGHRLQVGQVVGGGDLESAGRALLQ